MKRRLRAALAGTLLIAMAAPSFAQDIDPVRLDRRVGKLESELRAVQRKVFPGGDTKFFEPEVAPAAPVAVEPVGNPASSAVSDLTQRIGELERQLQVMTGQVEANQFKLRQLEEAQAKLRGDVEFRLTTLEGGPRPAADPALPALGAAEPPPATAAAVKPPAKPVATTPEAAWKAAYANVTAKRWPETVTAMGDFLAAHPKSPRAAQAQYWLGRANAERGQHGLAARAYLDAYKNFPRSDRAPDSLVGLAGAMTALKKPAEACRVLGELDSVYGATLTATQKAEARTARTRAKCAA